MLRHDYLTRQLEALRTRVRMLQGAKLTFDEESQALYDAVAPVHPESYFADDAAGARTAAAGRCAAGRSLRRLPAEIHHPVEPARRASSTARSPSAGPARCRTCSCRPNESFTVEYVTNKPWSGYNWYQGNYRSLIQVNTDLPIYIDRAIDLACHEGYPGHHVYNALLEKHLVRDRGWVEFTIYPLFSPQSLIAEGTANYGIEVAFPGDERAAFERDVLYPEAGLDPSQAAAVRARAGAGRSARLRRQRSGAAVSERRARSASRRRPGCRSYAMMSPVRAEQRTRFFDTYRSYVINYNLGKDLVKQYVESRGRRRNARRQRGGRSSSGCSRRRGCPPACADGRRSSRRPASNCPPRSATSTSTCSISCCAAASIAAAACSMPAAATAAT